MKFDGHSRSEAWGKPGSFGGWHLERPAEIYVDVFQGEEYTSPYIKQEVEIFGSKASDISTQELADMINKGGLKLESKFVSQSWKSAFKLVNIKSEETGRAKYGEILKELDTYKLEYRYTKKEDRGLNPFISTGIKGGILKACDEVSEGNATIEQVKKFINEFFVAVKLTVATDENADIEPKQISSLVSWIEKKVKLGANSGGNYDSDLANEFKHAFLSYAKA